MPFPLRYTPRRTVELFGLIGVDMAASPVAYRVKDQANEEVSGIFYETKIQKFVKPNSYKIDEILKKQTIRPGKTRASTSNSWDIRQVSTAEWERKI